MDHKASSRKNRGKPAPSVISLYTGAGGLDLGLEAAGFETRVCVEFDRESVRTVRHNRPWPVIDRDIATIRSEEILEVGGLKRGEVDLVAGGPPCQPFSKSAYWSTGDTKRLADPRASTLGQFMRVVDETLPRVFLIENVYGLTYEGKDEGMRFLRDRLAEINRRHKVAYSWSPKVLNAADFGVPQIRERVFIVGIRSGVMFQFPDTRFVADVGDASAQGSLFEREPYRTAWDAIGDLDGLDHGDSLKVGGRWAGLLPSIPEGQNYLWHSERGGGIPLFRWRSRYWSFLLKLAKRLPSWTIQAQPGSAIGPFHWRNRRLSATEMCRLQTFPAEFEVPGGLTAVQRQLGNAVPSALTEILGRAIRAQALGLKIDGAVTDATLIPPRRACPEPEAIARVPTRYRKLLVRAA